MNPELETWVRNAIGQGKPIDQIIQELKVAGYTQAQINTVFATFAKNSATPSTTAKAAGEGTQPKKHFDATRAFLTVGILLIVIAFSVVVFSQWSDVSPAIRVAFLAVPTLILYAISWLVKRSSLHPETFRGSLMVASVMTPFVFGTALFQWGLISEVGPSLFLTSTLLALPFYLFFEFFLKQFSFGALTVIALFVIFSSALNMLGVEGNAVLWLNVLFSLGFIIFGWWRVKKVPESGAIYLGVGALAVLSFLPTASLLTLTDVYKLEYQTLLIVSSLFFLVDFAVAAFLYHQYKRSGAVGIYRVKRVIEELAVFALATPYFFLAFTGGGWAGFLLALGVVLIFARTRLAIKSCSFLGVASVVIGVIALTNTYFADSQLWPVTLFIAGFLTIGLGLLTRKLTQSVGSNNTGLVLGLGVDPEVTGEGRSIVVLLILLLIFIPIAFYGLQFFLRSGIGSSSNGSGGSVEVKPFQDQGVEKTIQL